MKYVFILETGQLNAKEQKFNFYDMETFPTKKAAEKLIKNAIECNKGFCLEVQEEVKESGLGFRIGEKKRTTYTYDCMSSPASGEEPKQMRVRYVLRKMEINRNFS